MRPNVWLGYVLGRGAAIRELADNRATWAVGAVLVVLTAIARNYDQTFILEKPFLWLFGPLLFSLVSGTWLYLVVYGWFVRRSAVEADGRKPAFWGRWTAFMGLFWMTAPVAWLYAIPVERVFDSLAAAQVNLVLLAVVSLWRVILITRVVAHLARVAFHAVLLWVLFAAAMEILVVFFFGGAFARAIMAAMGGMRNSPEETLMMDALGAVFVVALWGAPVILILALIFGRSSRADDLPAAIKWEWCPAVLGAIGIVWLVAAVVPQIELSRNVHLERLVSREQYREALEYLGSRQPADFAPARVLMPNAYEWPVFTQLPACFGVVQTNDPPWVRAHLLRRLDQMLSHYVHRRSRRKSMDAHPEEEQVDLIANGLARYGPDAAGIMQLLDGLERLPEGRAWLENHPAFESGVRQAVQVGRLERRQAVTAKYQPGDELYPLSNRLFSIPGTNRIDLAPIP